MKKISKVLLVNAALAVIYMYIFFLYRLKSTFIRSCINFLGKRNFIEEMLQETVLSGCNTISYNTNIFKNELKIYNCSRPLSFLREPKPLVALASFPGSGNTWTRFLIETATGIYTGDVYSNDLVFIGSKICPARGKVFVVKTHRTDFSAISNKNCVKQNNTQLIFSSAIFILRNPYNALLANFNRINKREKLGNRTHLPGMGLAPMEMFYTAAWRTFVMRSAREWGHMALFWMQQRDIPVFVLVYEKLIDNVVREVCKLTHFLNYEVNIQYIHCLTSNITEARKRMKPNWLTKENMFSNEMRNRINLMIKDVNSKLGSKFNISDLLDTYILPVS